MRSIKIYTKPRIRRSSTRSPIIVLMLMLLLLTTAFSTREVEQAQKINPHLRPQTLSLKFYRPMIDLEKIEWIQWFGPTVFAYEEGDLWEYNEYCQGQHCGLDLGAPWGTEIYAGSFGIVNYVSNHRIEIWFGAESTQAWWKIIYMNIADIHVKAGQFVTPNTLIGTVGNHKNNQYAGGIFVDHLHLEVLFDPDPEANYKTEFHNPLSYFYDENIYQKLNQIAKKQYATRDWFYMRDVLLMGIDYPMESLVIERGSGEIEKTWFSWMGFRRGYYLKSYYAKAYPGPILYP